MAHTTTCPACGTTFRVTAGQLLARQGDVRCGRCGKVFNAHQSLTLNYPPPPPEEPPAIPTAAEAIPAPLETAPAVPADALPVETIETAAQTQVPEQHPAAPHLDAEPPDAAEIDFTIEVPDTTAEDPPAEEVPPASGQLVVEEFLLDHGDAAPSPAEPDTEAVPAEVPATLAAPPAEPEPPPELPPVTASAQVAAAPLPESDPELDRLAAQLHAEAISALSAPPETPPPAETGTAAAPSEPAPLPESAPPSAPPPPPAKKPLPRWMLPLGSLALLGILVLQSAVYFRTELIAYNPSTRPLFEQACGWLGCQVALPRNPDLLSIETSSLEAEPGRAGIVVLSATLRNRAGYAQSYPLFELTLTDYQDKLAARRIFPPQEYLPKDLDQKNGMPANEEIDVKLHLDLGELQAAGYRVYLFYSATTS